MNEAVNKFLANGREIDKNSITYILRTCEKDMSAYGGFLWPKEGPIECSDWSSFSQCGNGLHGFLMGKGNVHLASQSPDAHWLICAVWNDDIIDLGGKVKVPRAWVTFCSQNRDEAIAEIVRLGAKAPIFFRAIGVDGCTLTGGDCSTLIGGCGSTLAGGDHSILTGGDRSTLTGGLYSILTGGDRSTLTGGYKSTLTGGYNSTLIGGCASTLTGGDHSTLTGGDHSTLTGGLYSTLTGGYRSTLTGGENSSLTFAYYDGTRNCTAVAYVGKNNILPNTPYKCNNAGVIKKVAKL